MKRVSLWLTAALLATMMIAPAAQASPPVSPFAGDWIGQDPAPPDGDGSALHLTVGPGHHASITFVDEFGTICVNEGSPVTTFVSKLTGVVDGDTLWATFRTAHCGPVLLGFLRGAPAFWELDDGGTADPSDDTLWDGFTTWERA